MKKIPIPPPEEVQEVFLRIRMGMGMTQEAAQASSAEALQTPDPVRRLHAKDICRYKESHLARTSRFQY